MKHSLAPAPGTPGGTRPQTRSTGSFRPGEGLRRISASGARLIGPYRPDVILGQLAPAIQERILFLPTEYAALIAERELREIAREPRWDRQQARFEQLLATRA